MNIKSVIALVLLAASAAQAQGVVSSQRTTSAAREPIHMTLGVRGGYAGSFMSGLQPLAQYFPNSGVNNGYTASIFAEFPVTNNFSFQPELTGTEKGLMVRVGSNALSNLVNDFGGGNSVISDIFGSNFNLPLSSRLMLKNTYIEVAPLAKFYFTERPESARYYFLIGPSVGVLADSRVRSRVLGILPLSVPLPTAAFKPVEFSGIAGLGFELPVAKDFKFLVEGRYQHGFTRVPDLGAFQLPIRNRTFSGQFGMKYTL